MKLQTIALKEIKGLDKRVRQQMSPEKLEELSDSIKEQGQLVPIKVRPNGTGYVLVYGHRRVMAAKAAGQKDIEALVADVPDDKLLTQSLIENVVREDMAAIDIAKALQIIIDETGCTQEALGKKLGWARTTVVDYLGMLEPEIRRAIERRHADIGATDVAQAKAGTGGDGKLTAQVIERAARDGLNRREIRQVAEVVKRAQDFGGPDAVKRTLAMPKARLLEAADNMPPRKVKPTVREATGKIHFEWIKDRQVLMAEDAIEAARSIVQMIAKGERDPKGGKSVLRRLRTLTARLLADIDKGIERLE
jgi:ParB family chromosome partitioning protein